MVTGKKKIQISLSPGQRDNSNALPPGQNNRSLICGRDGKNYSRMSVKSTHRSMKTKRTRVSKSPWITAILKKRMNFRERLKRKATKTKVPFYWNQFQMVKNQVNWEINSAKKAYYENAFNKCYGDQKKTWKTINELTSRKSNKTVINEMEYNGVNSGDQTDIAEMLNSFFTEIGPSLSRDVTEVDK